MARILVIDDDPGIRSFVSDLLEYAGYEVNVAADGAEGLRVIEGSAPDAIVLDLMMPVVNGWEFVARCDTMRPRSFRTPPACVSCQQSLAARSAGSIRICATRCADRVPRQRLLRRPKQRSCRLHEAFDS
jgi:CheY-like chemotaxis protein